MQDNTGHFWAIWQDIHNLKNRTLQDKSEKNIKIAGHCRTYFKRIIIFLPTRAHTQTYKDIHISGWPPKIKIDFLGEFRSV